MEVIMNKYIMQALITVGIMFALNYAPQQVSGLFRNAGTMSV
jgi:hypothetical protein